MSDFNENAMVNNFIGPQLSAYALYHLMEFKYAELWYFTQEGCTDAMHQQTQNEDSFGLTKVEDTVSFRPVVRGQVMLVSPPLSTSTVSLVYLD